MEEFFKYWEDRNIEWFIVGGTADTDEAQQAVAKYPKVECLGVEPNPDYVKYQRTVFPGMVVECALWSYNTDLFLTTPKNCTPRSASVCRPENAPDTGRWEAGNMYTVKGRTLDSLSVDYGPFNNAALWIDIEYAELAALQGAVKLLSSKQIKIINLETFCNLYLPSINKFLSGFGYTLQRIWNIGTVAGRDAQDVIYTCKS